jgi:biotin-(acetyl-CoA carboxylase) ligase
MKQINLDDLEEGHTYYIQTQNYKFKAIYDRYEKSKFYFKKIIRLNTPKDWIGYIGVYEYMYYIIYESRKTIIQKAMETRAIQTILENITGTPIYLG